MDTFFGVSGERLEEMFVRPEGETEHTEIGKEQNHGDCQGELLFNQGAPAAGGAIGGAMKDRRDNQTDRGQ